MKDNLEGNDPVLLEKTEKKSLRGSPRFTESESNETRTDRGACLKSNS